MPTSDAAANAALNRAVTAGGSWWVGFITSDPDQHLAAALTESPMARVEIPRTSAVWEAAAGRAVKPLADVAMGTAPSDFTPTAWVLWDTPTAGSGTPQYAARIPDVPVTAGSNVVIPADTLTLTTP